MPFLSLTSIVSFHDFSNSGFNMLAPQSGPGSASNHLLQVISFSVSESVFSQLTLFKAEDFFFMSFCLCSEYKRVRTKSMSGEKDVCQFAHNFKVLIALLHFLD